MGNQAAEIVEGLPPNQTIKFQVHGQMCSELYKVVTKVSKIFPEIEAARPRCSSGIEALVMLNSGIVKAKSLLQYCSESSALYLALTGDAILSRCKKSRNLLEQSLCQIQSLVQVILASKISGIIADLRSTTFYLDPSEEEAGRILRELLHRYGSTVDSTEEAALSAIHSVSSRLRISSQKALLIERRSLRKLLDKFGDTDPSKRKILLFFMSLLKKYGKIIEDQKDNRSSERGTPFPFSSPYQLTSDVELRADYRSNETQIDIDILSRPVPPEEFICPLSLRLMYDPVVIASGQTYERMWIQKWFDEGRETCPKTNMKLPNLSFTSNSSMKDLIMKWSATHSLSVPDPKMQEGLLRSWNSTNSIASLTSSMNDLNLPLDYSNISFGSSYTSDPSSTKISNDTRVLHEIERVFLSKFSTLPWDSQRTAVEDVKKLLTQDDQTLSGMPGKFVRVILQFLKDAYNLHDMEAQMTGCLLLFEVFQKHRSSISYLKEDEYSLLASFLDTEVSKQALSVLAELSSHQECGCKIAASGALIGIYNILDSQIHDLLEPALKILTNLCSKGDAASLIVPSELIPKLIPLFEDDGLSSYCITILKSLWENVETRTVVAETDGCIASIVKLLEKESREEQEHAVSILLSLCSQRVQFCQLVMYEGAVPGLVNVATNGNTRAKAMAMELLRILKEEVYPAGENSAPYVSVECTRQRGNEINPPRATGFFGKIFSGAKKKK